MIRAPLDAERWQRATDIFERALDVVPDARDQFIEDEAHGDADIVATVRGMLTADEHTGEIIDQGIDSLAPIAFGAEPPFKSLSAGDVIGDFEIISELGRGGMGVVYAARDRKLGRVAALKLLPAGSRSDLQARDRLVAEAKAASALDHPNVATIYQVGETSEGQQFIAMARYEGETLRERLSRGRIPPREAFSIARQIASGLAAAHSAGLVHLDVKPENIFLTRQGLAKLLDFGIATLVGAAREGPTTRGTVLYMSPEQVRRETVGTASDVWSLGVVLFEMLNGKTPFIGTTPQEILRQIADASPVRLPPQGNQIPADASLTLSRALEKDQAKRFMDASKLLSELDRVERTWMRPRTLRIAAVAAIIVAAVGWSVVKSLPEAVDTRTVPTLAVLPVTGDSSDRESRELASGLRDEIAARVVGLGRMRLVHVAKDSTAQSSVKGLHVLRLAMDRGKNLPTISVSLERADTHRKIWGATRPLDREELREISRDLVIGILSAMGRPLNDQERSAIGTSFPSSSRAYEEYLRGNQLLAIRTPASVESAMVSFRQAAQLDSTFASAFARQSYAYTVLIDWGWKPSALFPGDPLQQGLALADRATRIDSTSADGWLARAYILVQKDPKRFAGAIEAFQHAIALDPYNAEAFHQYGQSLMALGRYTEALAAYRRVLDLEPSRAMTLVPMAAITKRLGRKLQALNYLDSAIVASPQIPYVRATRALLRAQLGDLKGARDDAETSLRIPSSYRIPQLGVLARVLWLEGDTAQALKRIREAEDALVTPLTPSPTDAFWLSIGEVTAGRVEQAKQLLRTVKPSGAVAWFMFQAEEFNEFRKEREVAASLASMDPRK